MREVAVTENLLQSQSATPPAAALGEGLHTDSGSNSKSRESSGAGPGRPILFAQLTTRPDHDGATITTQYRYVCAEVTTFMIRMHWIVSLVWLIEDLKLPEPDRPGPQMYGGGGQVPLLKSTCNSNPIRSCHLPFSGEHVKKGGHGFGQLSSSQRALYAVQLW